MDNMSISIESHSYVININSSLQFLETLYGLWESMMDLLICRLAVFLHFFGNLAQENHTIKQITTLNINDKL